MSKSPSRGQSARIEILEPRIAPAAITLINPQTASFIDTDGSRVYVQVTKGTFTQANIGTILTLAPAGLGYQLETVDLSKTDFKSEFEGATINIFAHPTASGGDGTVDVGYINATGVDIYGVRVHGDLGRISAGDTDAYTSAITSIDVLSMGELGTATQAPGGNLVSNIFGGVRYWSIAGNLDGATILAADTVSPTSHLSSILHMKIGGSVIGGATAQSGEIYAEGGFHSIAIGGDLIGGSADNTGEIYTQHSIFNLTVNGSLRGDGGNFSGAVNAPVVRHTSIGGDVIGGAGVYSGAILDVTGNALPSQPTLAANALPAQSGILTTPGGIGNNGEIYGGGIRIHGSLTGGSGNNSGFIQELNPSQTVIGGDVVGGSGADSGEIHATRAVNFRIGGSLVGADGTDSGSVIVDKIFNSIHVLRDMTGGSGEYSGAIHSYGERVGSVTVSGSIAGGTSINESMDAANAGSITCDLGAILGVNVGGSVVGGSGDHSATIQAHGSIGNVSIQGNLTAGTGADTASVLGLKSIISISVNGDVDGASTGVQFTGSAAGLLNTLTIGGDIKTPVSMNLPAGTIKVKGSIFAGDTAQGALTGTVIDRLHVYGGILGTAANPVDILISGLISGTGAAAAGVDAITLLRVDSSVTSANILAGYAPDSAASIAPYEVVNPSARIDTVSVGGDWAASNLVAGVSAGTDGFFGTADDTTSNTSAVFSAIAHVVIKGEAIGDANPADHFGIVAQEVANVTVAGYAFQLTPGPGNDTSVTSPKLNVGPTDNFTIHEVGTAVG
jgi:hypothetical protein